MTIDATKFLPKSTDYYTVTLSDGSKKRLLFIRDINNGVGWSHKIPKGKTIISWEFDGHIDNSPIPVKNEFAQ